MTLPIMIQPSTTSAAVEMPHSSAPSKVAIAKSRPCSELTVCPESVTLLSEIYSLTNVWCASDKSKLPRKACMSNRKLSEKHPCLHLLREIKNTSAMAFGTPSGGELFHHQLEKQFLHDSWLFRFGIFQSQDES